MLFDVVVFDELVSVLLLVVLFELLLELLLVLLDEDIITSGSLDDELLDVLSTTLPAKTVFPFLSINSKLTYSSL